MKARTTIAGATWGIGCLVVVVCCAPTFAGAGSIKTIGPGPTVIWDSDFWNAYRVLWGVSPGGPWRPLSDPLSGTGEEMHFDDHDATGRARFYILEITDVTPAGMVPIPGGTYEMGDHFGLDPLYSVPVHTVRVDSFYMDATEVVNADLCAFLNAAWEAGEIQIGPKGAVYSAGDKAFFYARLRTTYYKYSDILYDEASNRFKVVPGREQHPVVDIGWHGAAAYCNWRGENKGLTPCYDPQTWECNFAVEGYRLPTEAEWEYAARGGLRYSIYSWGDEIDGGDANFRGSGDLHEDDWLTGVGDPTTPVGSYPPNAYGLYDMAGNAAELCNDYFDWYYYRYCVENAITDNPTGPVAPVHGGGYVIRGGSCWSTPELLSCGLRTNWGAALGFRCVRRPRPL
jgi:formylglycine-generating enzyme